MKTEYQNNKAEIKKLLPPTMVKFFETYKDRLAFYRYIKEALNQFSSFEEIKKEIATTYEDELVSYEELKHYSVNITSDWAGYWFCLINTDNDVTLYESKYWDKICYDFIAFTIQERFPEIKNVQRYIYQFE